MRIGIVFKNPAAMRLWLEKTEFPYGAKVHHARAMVELPNGSIYCVRNTDQLQGLGCEAVLFSGTINDWPLYFKERIQVPAVVPIPMLLWCPQCHAQHVDAPDTPVECDGGERSVFMWQNPPHRSHLCHACGTIWRPADVPTTGVKEISTRGNNDTYPPVTCGCRIGECESKPVGCRMTAEIKTPGVQ